MEHGCALFLNSNINFLNNLILAKRNFVGVSVPSNKLRKEVCLQNNRVPKM
jgi:hypothetical protein